MSFTSHTRYVVAKPGRGSFPRSRSGPAESEAGAKYRHQNVGNRGVLQQDAEADELHASDRALVLPRLGAPGPEPSFDPRPDASSLFVLEALGAPFQGGARGDDQPQAKKGPEVKWGADDRIEEGFVVHLS